MKTLKSQIQKEQRNAYWNYIENMILNIPIHEPDTPRTKQVPKNLFAYIKTQKSENTEIPPLRNNGILHSDTVTKANILNEQFQKAFTPVSDLPIPDKGPSTYPTMPDIQITEKGIKKLLNNINPHKATGPDEIHGKILKECQHVMAPILSIIFKHSLSSGTLPNDWKHANVCPVYKKGEKHDPINYRPISLTCISCKILEHILASSMMTFLEENSILYDLQHGFRSSRSCETQLISFIQDLSEANDKNVQTDIIVMDFAKAFDKVSHKHLLYKMEHYGISQQIIKWVSEFLSNRTQTVVLGGESSNKIPVTSGVPQGTVLGPILFLIYINDLPDYLQYSTLRLFADDSIIYKTIQNPSDLEKLQSDLDAAGRWEKDWLMHFHPDKCSILNITQKRKPLPYSYKLHGHTLTKEQSSKYLGVTLQSNCKWDNHINNITSKANQTLGFLRRNLKVNSTKIKEHAYKALVRPKLEYAASVWDPHTSSQINQIEKVQRRAARYVTNRFHNTSSVTDMLQDLNWPTLEARRLHTRLVMFYKITNHLVAIYPQNLLYPVDHRTRQSHTNCYRLIQTNKDTYKYSFYPRTISQWNLLPPNITSADTLEGFKSLIAVPVLLPIFF